MNEYVQIISSVGFPIFACICLGLYVKFLTDSNNRNVEQIRKEHNQEVQKMTEALNNNTLALQRLVDKLDKE